MAPAVWLAPGAELGCFAAANAAFRAAAEAAACAAEAVDTGALAANTDAEAADAAAPDTTTADPLAAELALDGAAEAVGAADGARMVSDPGPVSGTGNGRVATPLLPSLEPMKEPPPSQRAKPMSPTQTAPAKSQRFDLEAVPAAGAK